MSLPAIYIPHGGGPWPFVDGLGPKEAWAPLEAYLRALVFSLSERPRALLVVSAHWEEANVTLMTHAHPPMLYDYVGFPRSTYTLEWPAPGAPDVARRARVLLESAGIGVREDPERGFDHGTFIPLMLSVPSADIPTLQVSLVNSLDPEAHLTLGRALAPLRDEGVLIIGSGNSYHNMAGFGRASAVLPSRQFDEWLGTTVVCEPRQRDARLVYWREAPSAEHCHPREEHLLPLHVVAGAARDDAGTVPFRGQVLGCAVSAVRFG